MLMSAGTPEPGTANREPGQSTSPASPGSLGVERRGESMLMTPVDREAAAKAATAASQPSPVTSAAE